MLRLRTLLCIAILGLLPARAGYSLPFAEGKAAGGYAYLPGRAGAKAVSTGAVSGSGRFGYQFDDADGFIALDVTAYRIYKASALKANNDGNSALLVFGYNLESLTLWLGGGAGELRSYDREDEKTSPYRYYATDFQLGANFDLYRSEAARLGLGIALGRIQPDSEWRERYGLESINTLQFEIGFKLLNW